MNLFSTPISSPIVITLTIVYFICAAVTTFDTRIIQAKKAGYLSENRSFVPAWTGLFGILMWLVFIVLILLNWWFAIMLFVLRFILKVAPVLENLGALLLLPVVGSETARSVNIVAKEQRKAALALKALSKGKQ